MLRNDLIQRIVLSLTTSIQGLLIKVERCQKLLNTAIYIHIIDLYMLISSVQFSSVAQSCPTLWDPMNHSTPGLPVHHQLPEFTQTHVHWVSDAIWPSQPLSSPSPPAFDLSQHQGLFKWVSSSHRVAKVLEFQLQHQSSLTKGAKTKWQMDIEISKISGASMVAQLVKNLPAMQETWVWSLIWEDPLEEGTANHTSIRVWKIPWTEEPGQLQYMWSQRVGHDWATKHTARFQEGSRHWSGLLRYNIRKC